jgi:mannose-P-dolichol utilization defect protein 1
VVRAVEWRTPFRHSGTRFSLTAFLLRQHKADQGVLFGQIDLCQLKTTVVRSNTDVDLNHDIQSTNTTTRFATMDAVRSALQPITHSLPVFIHDAGSTIIGDACYKALILDIDPSNTECVKLAVSKGLGIGIVAASSVVKVPQIIKLFRSRSASGVSFLSYVLETSSYLISLAYNFRHGFPFSTYGETFLILAQNIVITVLVLRYSGQTGGAAVFMGLLAAAVTTLFSPKYLSMEHLGYLQAGAGVLGVASKVPQIAAIWQQGGTGQLSAFAVSCAPFSNLCFGRQN